MQRSVPESGDAPDRERHTGFVRHQALAATPAGELDRYDYDTNLLAMRVFGPSRIE